MSVKKLTVEEIQVALRAGANAMTQLLAADVIDQLQQQVHELGRDRDRMNLLAAKARLVKYDSGYKASFDVSVNGLAEQGYHTDFRAAVDAAS